MRSRIAAGAEPAGRAAEDVGICIGAVTVVDQDLSVARALARSEVAMYLAVVAELDPTTTVEPDLLERLKTLVAAGDSRGAGELVPDALLDRFAFWGTPDKVATQAAACFEAGAKRVELGTPHGVTGPGGVRLIVEHVVPALRSAGLT